MYETANCSWSSYMGNSPQVYAQLLQLFVAFIFLNWKNNEVYDSWLLLNITRLWDLFAHTVLLL